MIGQASLPFEASLPSSVKWDPYQFLLLGVVKGKWARHVKGLALCPTPAEAHVGLLVNILGPLLASGVQGLESLM